MLRNPLLFLQIYFIFLLLNLIIIGRSLWVTIGLKFGLIFINRFLFHTRTFLLGKLLKWWTLIIIRALIIPLSILSRTSTLTPTRINPRFHIVKNLLTLILLPLNRSFLQRLLLRLLILLFILLFLNTKCLDIQMNDIAFDTHIFVFIATFTFAPFTFITSITFTTSLSWFSDCWLGLAMGLLCWSV